VKPIGLARPGGPASGWASSALGAKNLQMRCPKRVDIKPRQPARRRSSALGEYRLSGGLSVVGRAPWKDGHDGEILPAARVTKGIGICL
jgi:hypothetical protein